jgi:superfamily II DNA/RNA helicase
MVKPKGITATSVFIKANKKIDYKKIEEKKEETRKHSQRLADMQVYVDLSNEKISLLLDIIKNVKDEKGIKILTKGVIVYIYSLTAVDAISKRLEQEGIEYYTITSKTSQKNREAISAMFMDNPHNKVVLFSQAGGESIDLNSTNELILYNTPRGPGKFSQTIGRICRGFGEFTSFNIREVIVDETLDEFQQVLLSSKRETEKTILNSDTIPLRKNVDTFDADVLKRMRSYMLWKIGKRKKKVSLDKI